MDKILLTLFIVATGSLMLPAIPLGRFIVSGRVRQETKGRETINGVKEQSGRTQPAAVASKYIFRLLTTEEKKQFQKSWDAIRDPRASKPPLYLAKQASQFVG